MRPELELLDGPMGSRLASDGVDVAGPAWSARAVVERPEAVAAIHRRYAKAGATVHTAATFRATSRALGAWRALGGPLLDARAVVRDAVALARSSVPEGQLVAGSIASTADCYRPGEVVASARVELREHAENLAISGVDLLLCETFANPAEALVAVEEASRFGLPVWLALTLGPRGDLLDEAALLFVAERASALGAAAILVNCTPLEATSRTLGRLASLVERCGAYANAGARDDGVGHFVEWGPEPPKEAAARGVQTYTEEADRWVQLGASIVGGCCGTDERHVTALARRFGPLR
jgi:S-methylmethionine-dependent homocysteine/selenocysteine methylase